MDRTAALRIEVRRFVTACGTARALPTLVHVGQLAAGRVTINPGESDDAGLRADLVARALDRLPHGDQMTAWLTRGGHLTVGDADLAWCAAAEQAFGRHGRSGVPVHVVTRHGWLDVRTGERREWRRVRPLPWSARCPEPGLPAPRP